MEATEASDQTSEAKKPARSLGRVRRWVVRVLAVLAALLVLFVLLLTWVALTAPSAEPAPGWTLLADLPNPRGEGVGAVADWDGPKFVVVGGLRGLVARVSDAVSVYDPVTDTWEDGTRLPGPRHHHAAAGAGGDLYVAGGAASTLDWTPRTEVWRLSDASAEWEQMPPLPEGRVGHRMALAAGELHVVAGEGGSAVMSLDPGDPEAGWRLGADIPEPRDHVSAVVVDEEIWVIGGRNGDALTTRVDIYDPEADAWREGPALLEPTSAAVVGVVDGLVVVYGGEDPSVFGGGVVDRHWALDVDEGQWRPAGSPPVATHGAADAMIDGRLIVTGGASRQGALSTLSWQAATYALQSVVLEPDA